MRWSRGIGAATSVLLVTGLLEACGPTPDQGASATPTPALSSTSAVSPTAPPSASPSACRAASRPVVGNPAATYLVSLNQLILFGGRDAANKPVAATWQWSGGCWSQLSPSLSPPARSDMTAAYDPTHQVIVAFGGDPRLPGDGSLTFDSDTWLWNGSNWTEAAVAGPALIAPSIGFDPTSNRVILTGADGKTDAVNETWSWTGSSWQELHPTTAPPARIQAAMSEDPKVGQLVLFGGAQTNGRLNDTWIWDGSTWVPKTVTGPSPRSVAAMAFDRQSGFVLLVGGDSAAGPIKDLWLWDGSSWTAASPTHQALDFPIAVEGSSHVMLANGSGEVAMWTGQDWQAQ